MVVLRWLVFSTLLYLGGWVILCNWVIALRARGSQIPLFGGVFVAIALAVAPWEALHWLWWVPLLVDLGCVPLLLLTAGFLLWRAVAGKSE
jgi:hypothetical protein